MFYPLDRNNLSYGHGKGKYLPLYALFAMHPSALIHITESLASGQRRKQQLPLQQHSFLRSGEIARQKVEEARCVHYLNSSYSSTVFENLSTGISPLTNKNIINI